MQSLKKKCLFPSTNVREKEKWLADFDASAHLTSYKKYFIMYKAFVISKKIPISNKKPFLFMAIELLMWKWDKKKMN